MEVFDLDTSILTITTFTNENMSHSTWSQVDDYFNRYLVSEDAHLIQALASCEPAGIPQIQVAANQGKFLQMLAQICGAKSILEIGTLAGYSTIWLARSLPEGGRLISLEYDPKHAKVASENVASAGLSEIVEIIVGRASDNLPIVAERNLPPFDMVFIDADKASNPTYFKWAVKLTRPGSLIVVDNVVRNGVVIDTEATDADTLGIREFVELASSESKVTGTVLQTVGSKGYDGLAIFRVKD